MEKPKRKSKNKPLLKKLRFWLIIFFLLLSSVVICGVLTWAWQPLVYRDEGNAARQAAELILDVVLPDQAVNFQSAHTSYVNWDAYFRFEIPADLGLNWAVDAPCFEHFTRDPAWFHVSPSFNVD